MATESTPKPDFTDSSQYSQVWASLITNTRYLPGLLTLHYALRKHGSKYPLIALYTSTFPTSGHAALDGRNIPKKHVEYLVPSVQRDFTNSDPRFYDTWSKLTLFSLTEFERVVLLDCDMLVLRNMDELMEDVELDHPALEGKGQKVFAAAHACVCNPLRRTHYPVDWIPENCAYTRQHSDPESAQTVGLLSTTGLGMCNSGLLVVHPSKHVYDMILERINDSSRVAGYDFPDQALLSDLFRGRWVALPYIYNALKTLRRKGVHDRIWRDERVKNVHYILVPKPWDESEAERGQADETHMWWWRVDEERRKEEKEKGIKDG